MFPTDTDHCPTCGTDVDARALDMMVRNRQARDAQLQDFVTELHRRDAEKRGSEVARRAGPISMPECLESKRSWRTDGRR